MSFFEILKVIVFGIVEGFTEWLPISSTGHMILVDEIIHFDVSEGFREVFMVVIQLGAILAVVVLYFKKLNPFSREKTQNQQMATVRLWSKIIVGCLPAAVMGLLFDDYMERFMNGYVVSATLIIYGVFFILLENRNQGAEFPISNVGRVSYKTAALIGCFQVLAIVPGTSRSGATIIGGMLCGCSRTAAAEFTFFLAIPIMFGWGLVKCIKFAAAGLAMTTTEAVVLAVGVVSAFVMSVVSIKFLMGYIKKNDFTAFGWYRIVVGALVLGVFALQTAGILA